MSTLCLKAMVNFITHSNAYILENAHTASAYAQMMEIPGVNAAIAKIVVCDILHTELTAADEAFLNGSTVKRCQPWCRSGAGGGHAAPNAGLWV